MTSLITWLAHLSAIELILVKTTVLLMVAWCLHFILAQANPRWRVLLWRSVIVGLCVLVVAELTAPKFEWTVEHTMTPVQTSKNAFPMPVQPIAANAAAESGRPLKRSSTKPGPAPIAEPKLLSRVSQRSIVYGIWGLGVLICVIRILAGIRIAARRIAQSRPATEELQRLVSTIARRLHVQTRVELRVTSNAASPFLTGLMHAVIVAPDRLLGVRSSLQGVLAHELAHVRHHDLWWDIAMRGISSTLWFHPLTWKLVAAHASACEEIADAAVIEAACDVGAYTETLARVALESAGISVLPTVVPMARSARIVRRLGRLEQRVGAQSLGRMKTAVSLVTGISLLAGLAVFAIGETHQALAATAEKPPEGPKPADLRTTVVRVVNEEGKPVSGATVTPSGFSIGGGSGNWSAPEFRPKPAVTDAKGEAVITFYRRPVPTIPEFTIDGFILRVTHPDYCLITVHNWKIAASRQGSSAATQKISLQRGALLRVRSSIGNESAKGLYALIGGEDGCSDWTADADRRVLTRRVPTGKFKVHTVCKSPDGGLFFSNSVERTVKAGEVCDLHLPLCAGIRVAGKLSDAVPRPVLNGYVIVRATVPGETGKDDIGWITWSECKADGSFVTDSLPAGAEVRFLAACDGFYSPKFTANMDSEQPLSITHLKEGERPVVVAMEPGVNLELKIEDMEKAAIEGVTASVCTGCTSRYRSLEVIQAGEFRSDLMQETSFKSLATDRSGITRIKNLPPGECMLFLEHTSYEAMPTYLAFVAAMQLYYGGIESLVDSEREFGFLAKFRVQPVGRLESGQAARRTLTMCKKDK